MHHAAWNNNVSDESLLDALRREEVSAMEQLFMNATDARSWHLPIV